MAAHIPITPEDIQRTEAVLLGSLLLHPDTGNALRDRLQLEDFSEERHRLIYEALLTVLGTPKLDTVEALSLLLMEHELARIGGVAYLSALKQQAESTTMPIEDQAYLLKQATLHRLLSQIGETFRTRSVQYDSDDLKQVIDDLERAIRVAQQMLSPKDTLPPHTAPFQADLDDYLSDLDTRLRQNIILTGIATGFVDLDMITGGLQRSDLIIIAGPPSCGKTSFALSIALHVLLKEHRSVGLFSLEAPKRQVIGRLLSMEADLEQRLLRSLEMEGDEWTRLGKASTTLSDAKLWIDDTANLSTAQLHDKAHLLVARCGVELLIVDYAHLMLSSINDKRHENRVQEVGEISRSLKTLARDLTIPVLALAQVSRAFESRPTKNLQLSDLRDGSLENDADLVLFLSVSEADTTGIVGAPQLATISIAKHRNGPRANLDVCFMPGTIRFRDLQTLSQTKDPKLSSSSAPIPSNQPMTQFPRLQEIMARVVRGQPRQKDITSPPMAIPAAYQRELPRGAVLEDEEAGSETT
jgi:replicative DNA helicase